MLRDDLLDVVLAKGTMRLRSKREAGQPVHPVRQAGRQETSLGRGVRPGTLGFEMAYRPEAALPAIRPAVPQPVGLCIKASGRIARFLIDKTPAGNGLLGVLAK